MKDQGGYQGKWLRVDLSKGLCRDVVIDEQTLHKFLGEAGIAAKLLYDEIPTGIDSFRPENRLVFTVDPLKGKIVPGSGTICVSSKGPLIGGFAVFSRANGYFGAKLKFAGYDGIIIKGATVKCCYLIIDSGSTEIGDDSHLLGKDTYQTENQLKAELKLPRMTVVCIGPAGENVALTASNASDKGHYASNGGLRAVMGPRRPSLLSCTASYGTFTTC